MKHGIIGTLSEVFHELSVSNTWPLSEWEPKAKHEVSGHGIIGTLSEVFHELTGRGTIKQRQEKEEAIRQVRREAEESAIRMIKMQKFTIEEIQGCIPKLSIEDIKRLAKSQEQV